MRKLFALLCAFFLCLTPLFAQDCTLGTSVGSTCSLSLDGILTIPAGFDLIIEVKAWGAGGGSQTARNRRSGGGGGAYFNDVYSVAGGSTFAISVGQGVISSAGGDTSFDFDGGGLVIVGGGGLGANTRGIGGTGIGSIPGGNGGARETGGLNAGGGGGGSGPGNGSGEKGGNTTDGVGGVGGVAGLFGASGGTGGNDESIGSTNGMNGSFPGGGAGGKGRTDGVEDGGAGGDGQVIVVVTGVLPVELIRFDAKVRENDILLEWQTGSELNNKGFELQRSEDGKDWGTLGFVEGEGTTDDLSTYTFIDSSPIHELYYYRLKQFDFDGSFMYSRVISVVVNSQNNLITYPNPVKGRLILEGIESKEVFIQVYDTFGLVKYQDIQLVNTKLVIDTRALIDGNYYLKIADTNTGTSVYEQFVVKN